MLRPIAALVAPLVFVLVPLMPVHAQVPAAPATALPPGLVSAGIEPGWRDEDGTRIAALKLVLEPGWKTYWRVPGEAGIPPDLDFSNSTNVKDIKPIWPVPQTFDQNGMRTVGYLGGMVLPLRITPEDPAKPVVVNLALGMGICHDICVPADLQLSRTLDGAGAADDAIAAAMADVPHPADSAIARCRIEPIADGMRITARIALPEGTGRDAAALFERRSAPVWSSDPVVTRDGAVLEASADFVPPESKPFDLAPGDLRITVLDPGLGPTGAIEIDGCPDR